MTADPQAIYTEIHSRFNKVTKLDPLLPNRITMECHHGDCERIGQFVLRSFRGIQTYFACHTFKRGRLTIFFNK
jgi:hypothetical protein